MTKILTLIFALFLIGSAKSFAVSVGDIGLYHDREYKKAKAWIVQEVFDNGTIKIKELNYPGSVNWDGTIVISENALIPSVPYIKIGGSEIRPLDIRKERTSRIVQDVVVLYVFADGEYLVTPANYRKQINSFKKIGSKVFDNECLSLYLKFQESYQYP